eukprot:Em0004g527a
MFRCPTCERNSSIPVGGASVLPQNLHLGFEVEVAGYMSKMMNNSEVCCDECVDGRNGLAVVFCCMCHQFLCKVCRDYHSSSRRFSKHKIVLLDQAGARQLHTTMKPRDHYCSQPSHEDNKLNFIEHLKMQKRVVTKLTGATDGNNKMIEQVEISKQTSFLAINQAFEILQQTLEERKKTLFSELEAISLSKTTALTLQKEQFEKMPGWGPGTMLKYKERPQRGRSTHMVVVEVRGEMRSKTHNGAVVYGEVEDHRDGTYTITLTPQSVGPHQLLITMDGQHIQNSPNDLDVRPKRDYHTLCKAQQVIQCNEPRCVAIHDNGDIYVGSEDGCIYVFDQTGQLKNTIGSSGSGDGQFSHPSCIFNKGDVLYVADTGNHCVQKLTSSGKFLHKFGQKGSGPGQFNRPWAVIIDSNNKQIVSDSDNHRIHIFNENDGRLLTIDGEGYDNNCFLEPCGLALDPQGNIHVAAYGTNTIKVFTKEGVYVRMYGDPKCPIGIAIDDEGYSLVSEWSGTCLSIYDPEGIKICKVGNLNKPRDIALDPKDGSVFIANYGANTVLKYCV